MATVGSGFHERSLWPGNRANAQGVWIFFLMTGCHNKMTEKEEIF